MGGLVSAPKPKAVAMPDPAATAAANDAAGEAATRDARLKSILRARRGLPGTIATSERGVLDPVPAFLLRKTLLGQ
jgi:hypothetical protein